MGAAGESSGCWLRGVLETGAAGRPALREVLTDPDKHRLQVLVSLPAQAELRHEAFRVGAEYVYPASCVKLAAAVGALRFLRERAAAWDIPLEPTTPLAFHCASGPETDDDSNKRTRTITLAHELRKMFLVSDNQAFNRLLDLQGQQYLNSFLWSLGLTSARLRHRLYESVPSIRPDEGVSPALEWRLPGGDMGVCLPQRQCPMSSDLTTPPQEVAAGPGDQHVGASYIDASGNKDLHHLLVLLCRPDVATSQATRAMAVTEGDRQWLLQIMADYPANSRNPQYDRVDFPDDYGKFFLNGVARVWDKEAVRICNKLGQAYGFSTDTAYILNVETGQSFFLTASLYTNKNGVLNDDVYEYNLAEAFLDDLAEVITRALFPPASGSIY